MEWSVVLGWITKILWVFVVFMAGLYGSRILAGFARRGLERGKVDVTLTRFLTNVVRYTVMTLVVIACLGAFGIETTSFAALIGAAGLAIGLAFQGTLSSIAAGVMLLVLRPFKVGDTITVSGHTGDVAELGLFTTELDTPDNHRISIPNSKVFGADLVNYSTHGKRRVNVDVGTDYGADLDQVMEVLFEAARSVPDTLGEPQVVMTAMGASSVDWQVRVFCDPKDYFGKLHQLHKATKEHLDKAGIGIPFPQMDVHLDKAA